ncbi:MAG: hypothetical protein KatS3mg043_1416 [Rhodothermaceae bacterium]|nr:MAG: hypothetical protein KatS3mg043_1416 [Rhodothermaceae bacterium]
MEIASLGVTPAGSAYEVDPQTDFNSPPIVLAGGESLVVEATFSPTGVGFRSATVEVWDQFENLYTVSLFGTGVIEASPSSLAFGVVAVGSSAVRTLTLRNPSLELSVTVDNIYALGSSEETIEYTASPGGDFVLGPGESRDVSVTFAPTFPGTQNGDLYVMFTGGEQSAGIAIPLEGEGGFGRLTLSPEALDFGEVAVGDSVRQELTLANEGGASLTVFEVTLTGDDAGAFTVGSVPATLSPGESFPVEVVFAPGRLGEQVAELEVTSDDPGGSSRVLLRGQGVSSFILSDNALDFGAVRVGQTQRRTFTVTNRTAGPLVLALSLDDEAGFDLEGGVSFVLQDGEAREVAVSFAPAARGVQTTTLRVQAPETEAPEQTVALRGQGVAPQMQVSADSLDFGTVVVGLSTGLPLELSNAGDDVLAVSELAIEGAGAAAFSLVEAGESFLLEPGAQRTLAVQFAPRSGGEQAAVLRIRSDDPEQPQRDVVLAGSGAAIQNESPVLGVVNTAVDVRFVLPPDFEPTTARLFYRVGGRRTYETTDLLPDANQYGGAIPAEAMTLRGVQYYAEFVREDQVVTIPPQDPTGHPEQIRVQVDHVPAEVPASFLSLRPETYALVSVPLELADPGIPAVLADDYGTYDPARWRVLRWATASEAYAEFPGLEDGFSGGRAFWLITRDGQGFDVDNGLSTDLSGPFVIILPPGWSQIGNPFAFPVAVDDTEAGGVLEGPHAFDGQQYLPNRSVLQPWQGYFVFNPGAGPVTLSIPPVEAGEVAAKEVPLPWQAADFAVQLMAEVPRYGLRDTYNAVGFAGATMAGWGSLDLREPPGIGPHVQLSIVENGRRYLSRFVRAPESGAAWDLEVSATLPGSGAETVLVTLVEHGARPAGFVLYVLDRDEGQVLPAETGRFAVTLAPERPVRRLRLIMGTEDFAESRADGVSLAPSFSLEPNHPNPFNPTTLIRYSLGGESPVSLEVFNVLGERVRTLVDRHQRGGSYEVIWDGRDESGRPVASGVYVYRLRAGTFTASRTMVLLR